MDDAAALALNPASAPPTGQGPPSCREPPPPRRRRAGGSLADLAAGSRAVCNSPKTSRALAGRLVAVPASRVRLPRRRCRARLGESLSRRSGRRPLDAAGRPSVGGATGRPWRCGLQSGAARRAPPPRIATSECRRRPPKRTPAKPVTSAPRGAGRIVPRPRRRPTSPRCHLRVVRFEQRKPVGGARALVA